MSGRGDINSELRMHSAKLREPGCEGIISFLSFRFLNVPVGIGFRFPVLANPELFIFRFREFDRGFAENVLFV